MMITRGDWRLGVAGALALLGGVGCGGAGGSGTATRHEADTGPGPAGDGGAGDVAAMAPSPRDGDASPSPTECRPSSLRLAIDGVEQVVVGVDVFSYPGIVHIPSRAVDGQPMPLHQLIFRFIRAPAAGPIALPDPSLALAYNYVPNGHPSNAYLLDTDTRGQAANVLPATARGTVTVDRAGTQPGEVACGRFAVGLAWMDGARPRMLEASGAYTVVVGQPQRPGAAAPLATDF